MKFRLNSLSVWLVVVVFLSGCTQLLTVDTQPIATAILLTSTPFPTTSNIPQLSHHFHRQFLPLHLLPHQRGQPKTSPLSSLAKPSQMELIFNLDKPSKRLGQLKMVV